MDFKGATDHFADPEFDGDPVQVYEPGEGIPWCRRRTRSARQR